MSVSTLYVSPSYRRIFPSVSSITTVVLLSSFTSSFSVTVQDTNGYASISTPILISTTSSVGFAALPLSTFTLTQPYSFLTLEAISPTQWKPIQSFSLPSTQAIYSISTVSVSTMQTSTGTALQQSLTNISLNHIKASSIIVACNATARNIVQIAGNAVVQSTMTTTFLSTNNLFAQSSISTIGSLAVHGQCFAGGALLQSTITLQSNATFQTLSTQQSLFVQRNATLSTATIERLSNLNAISTQTATISSITGTSATFLSTVQVNALFSLTEGSLATSTANFTSTLTPILNIGAFPLTITGPANFTSNFIAQGVANVSDSVIALNATVTSLQVSTISTLSSLFVASNAYFRNSTIVNSLSTLSQLRISSFTYTSTLTNFPNTSAGFPVNIIGSLNASTNILRNTSTITLNPNNFTVLNPTVLRVIDTTNIRSQSLGFNDITGVLNCLVARTSTLFWSATGYYPNVSFTGQYMLCPNDNSNLYFSSDYGSNFTQATSTLTGGLVKDGQISGNGIISALAYGTTNFTWSANAGVSWFTKSITTVGSRTLLSGDAIGFSFTGEIQLLAGRTNPSPVQNNLMLSQNFGSTWTSVFLQGSASSINWSSVALSSNGQYMVAVASNTRIFFSSNTGTTWTQIGPTTPFVWSGVAISYSGQYITASASNSFLYTSSNFGSNWTARDSVRTWGKVSMSQTGQYQVASANVLDRFFYSADFGVTWNPRLVFGVNTVRGVAISKSNAPNFIVASAVGPLYSGASSVNFRSAVDISGNLSITGTLSKAAGSFDIPHPTDPRKTLVHSFLEAPRTDLLYRGCVITDATGCATVDLDREATSNSATMTPGTFAALARHPQVFLRNNTSSVRVKGCVKGSSLTLQTFPLTPNQSINWMVVAERCDPTIRKWRRVDRQGYLILEA